MLSLVKGFVKDEEGMGTVEIVVIIAVLVTVALIFRKAITQWVQDTLADIFSGASEGAEVSNTAG